MAFFGRIAWWICSAAFGVGVASFGKKAPVPAAFAELAACPGRLALDAAAPEGTLDDFGKADPQCSSVASQAVWSTPPGAAYRRAP